MSGDKRDRQTTGQLPRTDPQDMGGSSCQGSAAARRQEKWGRGLGQAQRPVLLQVTRVTLRMVTGLHTDHRGSKDRC